MLYTLDLIDNRIIVRALLSDDGLTLELLDIIEFRSLVPLAYNHNHFGFIVRGCEVNSVFTCFILCHTGNNRIDFTGFQSRLQAVPGYLFDDDLTIEILCNLTCNTYIITVTEAGTANGNTRFRLFLRLPVKRRIIALHTNRKGFLSCIL